MRIMTGPAATEATRRLDAFAAAFAGAVVTDPRRLQRILRRADPAVDPTRTSPARSTPTPLSVPASASPDHAQPLVCQPLDCANVALTNTNHAALRDEAFHIEHELARRPAAVRHSGLHHCTHNTTSRVAH